MNNYLYWDASTNTYFKSNAAAIHDTVRDIFYDVYLPNTRTTYVDLIKELQRRLGIPEISDEKLCDIYSTWDGRFIDLKFQHEVLTKGTSVTIIYYA